MPCQKLASLEHFHVDEDLFRLLLLKSYNLSKSVMWFSYWSDEETEAQSDLPTQLG